VFGGQANLDITFGPAWPPNSIFRSINDQMYCHCYLQSLSNCAVSNLFPSRDNNAVEMGPDDARKAPGRYIRAAIPQGARLKGVRHRE
jgi:hypothetical protein